MLAEIAQRMLKDAPTLRGQQPVKLVLNTNPAKARSETMGTQQIMQRSWNTVWMEKAYNLFTLHDQLLGAETFSTRPTSRPALFLSRMAIFRSLPEPFRNQGCRYIILRLVGGNQSCVPIPPSSKFCQALVIVDMGEVMEVGPSWQKPDSEVTTMLVESNPNDVQLVIDGIPFMKAAESGNSSKNCRLLFKTTKTELFLAATGEQKLSR